MPQSHISPDQPGKETAEVITANVPHNTARVHKHSISTGPSLEVVVASDAGGGVVMVGGGSHIDDTGGGV